MQSDLFDKKIKDAADHHHPAYDEQAWTGMRKLLDKFLPEEKDRRRGLFFIILLFLLVGGGLVWFTTKPSGEDKSGSKTQNALPVAENKVKTPTSTPSDKTQIETPTIASDSKTIDGELTEQNNRNYTERSQAPLTLEKIPNRKNKSGISPVLNSNPENEKPISQSNTVDPGTKKSSDRTDVPSAVSVTPAVINNENKPSSSVTTPAISPETTVEKNTKAEETTKKEPQATSQKSKDNKKNKSKQPLPLFASLSMGPDISFAGSSSLGSTRLLTGIGMGYTFKDRLTIRTGFYSGRKVYSASPDEYNPPPQFWTYYPHLQKVDANCKVYEIPITFSYDFGRSNKQKWFASAGLSSVIMKEETYDYYYKYYSNPNAPTYHSQYTIKNENKHLFSVLTLSGGYKRNISNRVFVMAEPYVKLSLQGLGYGKVKLNSGGVMVSAGIKPFSYSKPR